MMTVRFQRATEVLRAAWQSDSRGPQYYGFFVKARVAEFDEVQGRELVRVLRELPSSDCGWPDTLCTNDIATYREFVRYAWQVPRHLEVHGERPHRRESGNREHGGRDGGRGPSSANPSAALKHVIRLAPAAEASIREVFDEIRKEVIRVLGWAWASDSPY